MSIVGPRPHMLRHTVRYASLAKDYQERHTVRPGITGLAQVRGYIGAINTMEDLENRLKSDLEYVESWSFGRDVQIFFSTVFGRFTNLPQRLSERTNMPPKRTAPALSNQSKKDSESEAVSDAKAS